MISPISSFEIVNIVIPDPKISLCIPVSAADDVAVNPKGIKILLANSLSKFFVKNKPVFCVDPTSLPINHPASTILDN